MNDCRLSSIHGRFVHYYIITTCCFESDHITDTCTDTHLLASTSLVNWTDGVISLCFWSWGVCCVAGAYISPIQCIYYKMCVYYIVPIIIKCRHRELFCDVLNAHGSTTWAANDTSLLRELLSFTAMSYYHHHGVVRYGVFFCRKLLYVGDKTA